MSQDLLNYIIIGAGLILDLLIAAAAVKMANRKDRAGGWGILCFLFAPLLLLLWMLPDKSKKYGPSGTSLEAHLQTCGVCGGPISSDAKKCPNCGAKNVTYKSGRPSAVEYSGLASVILILTAAFGAFLYTGKSPFGDGSEFPACSSPETKDLAESIYKDIAINSLLHKKIVSWRFVNEVSPGTCHAKILSSSGDDEEVDMKYSNEDGKVIMRLSLSGQDN